MSIQDNLLQIKASLPQHVSLVAVSKFHPTEAIAEAYQAGHRVFGESKVQELQLKQGLLPNDIEWHFIGHLQTNKIKLIAPFVSLIHGVDSERLLSAINKEGAKCKRVVPCLLQVHIAEEDTKFGFSTDELTSLLAKELEIEYENIAICGLMGMATLTDNTDQIRAEFSQLKRLFDKLKNGRFKNNSSFVHLSMGMSSDYQIAIEEGSTMVRIGSSIFGNRSY